MRNQPLWPGTRLAWNVMWVGFGIMVGLFALAAVMMSGMAAVQLVKRSSPPSPFWTLITLMAPFPAALGVLVFWRVRRLTSDSPHRKEVLQSLVLNLLLLLFFTYFLLDLLLIRLAPMTGL